MMVYRICIYEGGKMGDDGITPSSCLTYYYPLSHSIGGRVKGGRT